MPVNSEFIGTSELPWDEGTHKGPDAHDAGNGYEKETWTLSSLTKEFWLYSPYVLVVAGLEFDPVHLCWEENKFPENELPYAVESPLPLLTGPKPPFDSVLFACPLPYARTLQSFLDRMTLSSGTTIYDSVHQRVNMVDWVMLHRMSVAPPKPPTAVVSLYGVESTDTSFVWVPPKDLWRQRFTLVRRDTPSTNKSRK